MNKNKEKNLYYEMRNKFQFGALPEEYIKTSKIDKNILISLRSAYVLQNIIKNYHIIDKVKLVKQYDKQISILDLSNKYKIPPLTLLKLIYKQKNYSDNKIKQIIDDHKNVAKNLEKYDQLQLNLALNNDVFTIKNEADQLKQSLKFEKKVEDILIKHGITYKTQESLIKETPYSTPDFLLNSKITIDKKDINWIEVKNFYGACTKFIYKKIQKQISKYIKLYGPGCLIFSLGACSDMKFDNTLIIAFDKFIL
jgi:hypothetical protein